MITSGVPALLKNNRDLGPLITCQVLSDFDRKSENSGNILFLNCIIVGKV